MKKYLIKIDSRCGATMHIGLNSDNVKPVFVYYCGRDTGKRYVNIGSAARYLEKIAESWSGASLARGRAAIPCGAAGLPLHGRRGGAGGLPGRGAIPSRASRRSAPSASFLPFCKILETEVKQ